MRNLWSETEWNVKRLEKQGSWEAGWNRADAGKWFCWHKYIRRLCSPHNVSSPELAGRIGTEDPFTSFSRLSVNKCPWVLQRQITCDSHQELDLKYCKAILARTEMQMESLHEMMENLLEFSCQGWIFIYNRWFLRCSFQLVLFPL